MSKLITEAYLESKGWVKKGDVLVKFINPRLGWKDDGTLYMGYFTFPVKITTISQLEHILSLVTEAQEVNVSA